MKKRIFICLLILTMSNVLFAKKYYTEYCYKELSSTGCCCKFSIIKDTVTYLVLETSSFTNVLDSDPKIHIKFFNDDVITLYSENVRNGNKAVVTSTINNMSAIGVGIGIGYETSIAKFQLKDKDIEKFALGIKKIRISTIPNVFEVDFKKDKIGYKIYKLYLKAKSLTDF